MTTEKKYFKIKKLYRLSKIDMRRHPEKYSDKEVGTVVEAEVLFIDEDKYKKALSEEAKYIEQLQLTGEYLLMSTIFLADILKDVTNDVVLKDHREGV